MKVLSPKVRFGFLLGGVLLVALALPAQVWAQGGQPQSGSLNAPDIYTLFNLVLAIAVGVFLLVEGLLLYAIIRYRRRSNDEMPKQVHGSRPLELGWTIGSFAIVLVLFFFTLGFYGAARSAPPENALVVEVVGHTWYWEFRYPDTGVAVMSGEGPAPQEDFRPPVILRVPAGRPVVLEITSQDVIHSFWVPELSGKIDAIPGRTQRLWFQVDEPRTYVGQCAEFCGRDHYNMLMNIEVMEPEAYAAWMDEQAAAVAETQEVDIETASQELTGDPGNGQALYAELACVGCHSLDGSELVGPSFQGIAERAGARREVYEPEQYLRESILHPCDFIVENFTCVMPQNYAQQLDAQELADLIAFLMEQ